MNEIIEVESLTVCTLCRSKFDEKEHCPKILPCQHHFCLKCINKAMVKNDRITCNICHDSEPLSNLGAENLPTYKPIIALASILTTLGFTDFEHIKAKKELNECFRLLGKIDQIKNHQRSFQMQILDACINLKASIEASSSRLTSQDLRYDKDILSRFDYGLESLTGAEEIQAAVLDVTTEKQKLLVRFHELEEQYHIEDVISSASTLLDFVNFPLIRGTPTHSTQKPHPLVLLANYSTYQILKSQAIRPNLTLLNSPSFQHPRYFFSISVDKVPVGQIVIETRPDLAPKMALNFATLCTNAVGPTYRDCCIFQCWAGESIITGDYETNSGRGSKAVIENGTFVPDDTRLAAVRGSVGMRRTQKKHDNLCMVGSQFRIILQEMPVFSAVFAHVVDGIELVDAIARFSDRTGKPTKTIVITACGQY